MVLQGLCDAVLLVLHGFVGDAFRAVFHGLFRFYKHVYIASSLAFGGPRPVLLQQRFWEFPA